MKFSNDLINRTSAAAQSYLNTAELNSCLHPLLYPLSRRLEHLSFSHASRPFGSSRLLSRPSSPAYPNTLSSRGKYSPRPHLQGPHNPREISRDSGRLVHGRISSETPPRFFQFHPSENVRCLCPSSRYGSLCLQLSKTARS